MHFGESQIHEKQVVEMKKENKKVFWIAICIFVIFVLWTILIRFVDIEAIGPEGSTVGFAKLNRFIHELTGVHMPLYYITDWLSLVPIGFVIGFALLGLVQWIKRKKLSRVDGNLFVLGSFYIVVMLVYLLFEVLIINYRPILINSHLEASYPSSTTILVMCIMPTAIMQLNRRIKSNRLKICIFILITAFTVFMVVARLLSGVHWFTDIVGGILLSTALVSLYRMICNFAK